MKESEKKLTRNFKVSFNENVFKDADELLLNNIENLSKNEINNVNYKLAKENRANGKKYSNILKLRKSQIKNIVETNFDIATKNFDYAMENLDKLIKTYELELKEIKRNEIKKLYKLNDTEINQKWLNQSFNISDVKKEIVDKKVEEVIFGKIEESEKYDKKYQLKITFDNISENAMKEIVLFSEKRNGKIEIKGVQL